MSSADEGREDLREQIKTVYLVPLTSFVKPIAKFTVNMIKYFYKLITKRTK